jgi:hypothetical protein
MSELVLKSALAPDTVRLKIRPALSGRVQLIVVDSSTSAGCILSKPDAYRLRDFLNKELDGQASEPMGTGPWVYLETDSKGNNWWSQFPTKERVKNFAADYFRANFGLKYQAVGLLHQQLVPVVTTTHEWKDIS